MLLPDSKTGARPIYLGDAVVGVQKRQKPIAGDSWFAFPSPRLDQPLVNLRKAWVQVCEMAELDASGSTTSVILSQASRWGRGHRFPSSIGLLGHSQAQTTMRYAHVDIDPTVKAANEVGASIRRALRPSGKILMPFVVVGTARLSLSCKRSGLAPLRCRCEG